MRESEKYYSLIKNWHSKASEDDYFAKFMFEYLAFVAYLRTQWNSEQDIQIMKSSFGKVTDRDYIQALKQDLYFTEFWNDFTVRSTKNKELVKTLTELVDFLKREPLHSDGRWWNFNGFNLNQKNTTQKRNGVVKNIGDIENLIEFWCSVRNNLFHGDKNQSLKRDKDLVRYAFITLNFFVENILLAPAELRRVYPAIWEDFWHRFKRGEAEINTKVGSGGATGNIYECAFLEEHRYPILLLEKQLTQTEIIRVINEELLMSGELANNTWLRINSAAGNRKKELKQYFGKTVDILNKTYGLKLSTK